MNKLQQLARESADIGKPEWDRGLVALMCHSHGMWQIDVHVHNEFALHHRDRLHDDEFGVMTERGDDLDVVVDRMLARVQAAVAGSKRVAA